ncbi:hypothetical protein D1872_290280 [compost metagenome]
MLQNAHVGADHFRIRSHDRAIKVVVLSLILHLLVYYSRIKNKVDPIGNQTFYMTVYQFGRITDGFGRDAVHPFFIQFFGRFG